jgi:plasmid stability protein
MASLTLKDIPPDLLERLRARAKEERRSLSAEAITILERQLLTGYRTPEERAATADPSEPPKGERQADSRTPEQRAETARIWAELAEEAAGLPEWDVPAIYAARTPGRPVDL